jgi:hypothetical protein
MTYNPTDPTDPDVASLIYLLGQYENRVIPLELDIWGAYVLVGQLQLVLRHPENIGPSADCARVIAQKIQQYLGEEIDPAIALSLERGWHPEFDVAGDES